MMDMAGGIVQETVRGVASAISFITMVTVALIFLLFELLVLPQKLRSALPREQDATRHVTAFTREIQRYLGIKTVISIGTGLIVGFWVWIMGVDFALFWGVAAFLLNYIPVLGPLIAGVPAVLYALVQLGWAQALVLASGYLVIKLIIGDLIEPALMGRRFGLSTFMVLVALVFWGWVWGPLGMILSVPLTMMIKIALSHTERYRWVAVLLGPGPPAEPPQRSVD
jgi:predicted PurR-regulated permease PerM